MKTNNFKKGLTLAFATVLLSVSTVSLCYAFGEKGCTITPGDYQGACFENTEGTYNCAIGVSPMDCTSS